MTTNELMEANSATQRIFFQLEMVPECSKGIRVGKASKFSYHPCFFVLTRHVRKTSGEAAHCVMCNRASELSVFLLCLSLQGILCVLESFVGVIFQ